jgi:hypothetical protein
VIWGLQVNFTRQMNVEVRNKLLTELVKILAALFVKIDTDCKVQIENNFKKEKIVGELILSDFRPIITIVIKTV